MVWEAVGSTPYGSDGNCRDLVMEGEQLTLESPRIKGGK